MKEKQRVDLITGLLLTFIAIVVLILPSFNIFEIKNVYLLIFSLYTVINLIRFFVLRKTKDFEGLYYAFASLVCVIQLFVIKSINAKELALILFTWIALISLAKLKKADYYSDRRDRMYKFGILDLVLFLLAGIITCINLAYPGDVQILMVGFFFLVNGILEIFDPIIKSLIAHS